MSHQATTWVLERSEQEGRNFIVLFVIANHCHPDGTGAFPSMKTIGAQSRTSERSARRAVKELEKSGELLVVRAKGGVADEEWHSRNDYSIPGVVRDGFYRERQPKPEATVAAGEGVPTGQPKGQKLVSSGQPSGHDWPPNYPKELRENKTEEEELPPPTNQPSKKSEPSFDFSNFSNRYYKLVGTTPDDAPWNRDAYAALCTEWGEDLVLGKLEKWIKGKGGLRSLRGNQYGPNNFLKEVKVMLESDSSPDLEEASYANINRPEDPRVTEYRRRFPTKME